ncbi:hypothetical protein [Salimicrobium flavidum]|uniref:Uncharacterized protein n=1 Tax=Salimicrobium flavidum TaxID=570947 RepID=A0A1N7J2E7_9BACI|nr:hypothetical protein [Salimicrobium flavidum]SIS43538.1 hypothetical protein SAMN05421687_103247 [Salimicrobium flavidum]
MEKITLWAETEAEIQDFLHEFGDQLDFEIDSVYVAKRSSGKRAVGHRYLEGVYYPYDLNLGATLEEEVVSPDFIKDLVQWCSQDIIIATQDKPLLSIELTYHLLTYNNVAQRIPRLVNSASLEVPTVIFQKVDYEKYPLHNSWFLQTFLKTSVIYDTPCMALTFDEKEFESAKNSLIELVNSSVNDEIMFSITAESVIIDMKEKAQDFDVNTVTHGKNGKERRWVTETDNRVTVSIGVRDNCALTGIPGYGCQGDREAQIKFKKELKHRPTGAKGCVWLSKGTGGMDPYPGLVKMCEILLCYDNNGQRIKELFSFFTCLPQDFWWFHKYPNETYYKLIREFSDKVLYADDYK